MSQALEEESDPTFTHFAHRADFKRLLERFIILDVGGQSTIEEEEEEDKLVEALGAIVSGFVFIA